MRLGVYILMNNSMDILSANNLSKFYSKNKGLFNKQSINLRAVNNININLKEEFLKRFPHEFSGGQAQRIGIARVLLSKAKIIILDEPVSALDVSVQSQILNLLNDLQKKFELSYIVISHDLAVIEAICDRVMVMYFGDIVEKSDAKELFQKPYHPYTNLLLNSVPKTNQKIEIQSLVETELPDPINPPKGCSFYSRCENKTEKCKNINPSETDKENRKYKCFFPNI